jgi:hypothetical protein
MYGPGSAPPQPRPAARGLAIGLRVLFVVLPVVTLGTGAWGSMLRLALVLRRPVDWVLMPVVAVIGVGGFILVGISPDDESSWQINVGVCCLMLCMFATPVYFLIADIRGARAARRPQAAGPAQARVHPHPYAPGPTLRAPATGAIPTGPGIPGGPPYGYGQQPAAASVPPAPPVPSVPPTGPRIHQVRAELDELSDFLRKEEGR